MSNRVIFNANLKSFRTYLWGTLWWFAIIFLAAEFTPVIVPTILLGIMGVLAILDLVSDTVRFTATFRDARRDAREDDLDVPQAFWHWTIMGYLLTPLKVTIIGVLIYWSYQSIT